MHILLLFNMSANVLYSMSSSKAEHTDDGHSKLWKYWLKHMGFLAFIKIITIQIWCIIQGNDWYSNRYISNAVFLTFVFIFWAWTRFTTSDKNILRVVYLVNQAVFFSLFKGKNEVITVLTESCFLSSRVRLINRDVSFIIILISYSAWNNKWSIKT